MNQYELQRHIEGFAGRGKYLLSVDCERAHAHINLSSRHVALLLCETAQNSGAATQVRLFYYPKRDAEVVLFEYRAEPRAARPGPRRKVRTRRNLR